MSRSHHLNIHQGIFLLTSHPLEKDNTCTTRFIFNEINFIKCFQHTGNSKEKKVHFFKRTF